MNKETCPNAIMLSFHAGESISQARMMNRDNPGLERLPILPVLVVDIPASGLRALLSCLTAWHSACDCLHGFVPRILRFGKVPEQIV